MYAYNYCYQSINGTSANISYYAFSGLTAVICFASATSLNNATNISSDSSFNSLYNFIGNDTYYPNTATDNRFSQVLFSPYFRETANCVSDSAGSDSWVNLSYTLNNTYNEMRTVLLYVKSGTVVREKEGFICSRNTANYSSIPNTKSYITDTITKFRNTNPNALIQVFEYPRIFKYFGYGAVYELANYSYFANAPLDDRSPRDLSRRGGISYKCAAKSCQGHTFIDRRTDERQDVHDYVYKATVYSQIANDALNALPNAS